jgi:hypothetical protein
LIVPTQNIHISEIWVWMSASFTGSIAATLLSLGGTTGPATITNVVQSTPVAFSSAPAKSWLRIPFNSEVALTAGTPYGVCASETDGLDTAAFAIGADASAIQQLPATGLGQPVRVAKKTPTTSDTADLPASSSPFILAFVYRNG